MSALRLARRNSCSARLAARAIRGHLLKLRLNGDGRNNTFNLAFNPWNPIDGKVLMFARSGRFGAYSILLAGLVLSGCGTTPTDRGLSGGLLGAGTGAAIGAVAGNAGAGALVGGVGGAAIGALTSPDDLNLGPPFWRRQASVRTECVRWSASTGRCVRTAQRYTTVARADTADWIASCSQRYRSFDPASGTYLGYDGYRHYCR